MQKPHTHFGVYELVVVEVGRSTVICESHVLRLEGSYAIFYPVGITHMQINDPNYEYRRHVIRYPSDYLSDLIAYEKQPRNFFVAKLGVEELSRLNIYISRLEAGINEKMCTRLDMERKHLLALIFNELDSIPHLNDIEVKHKKQELNILIAKICTYIINNLDSDLTVEGLAKHFYISQAKLTRLFRKQLGLTVNYYVNHKRIELGCVLLEKNMTVTEIAERCGFSSTGYFIRVFKQELGITPRKYRESIVADANQNNKY